MDITNMPFWSVSKNYPLFFRGLESFPQCMSLSSKGFAQRIWTLYH